MPPVESKSRDEAGQAPPDASTPPPAREATPQTPTPLGMPRIPLSDRYEIQATIGAGGMGKVYKAFDRKLKRLVALKFLHGGDDALERRFLQEAQAQARVDHPNVCKVFEVGRIDEEPYIAMQFIEGKTLRDAAPHLSLEQKLAIVRDIASAVHGAHALGLMHRDIKPA